jgi:VCBS repeat-containing protein
VSVTVTNVAPVALGDAYSTVEETQLVVGIPGVLGNDSDANGDTLGAILDATTPHGTLAFNVNGSFTYTPDADYFGTDTFTYHADDGLLDSEVVTVTITVEPVADAPVAAADTYGTDEDTFLTVAAPGVLANDTDPDGDALTAELDTTTSNGTLVMNADGSFSYMPDLDYFGTDTFSYHASDGLLASGIVTVTITVASINDAPVATADSYSTDEDTLLTVAAPGVLTNDMDPDGDALTAELDTTTPNGSLVLNPGGAFTYTPDAEFHGTDTFTYHARDGLLDSGIVTVTITVASINDAPVAVEDAYSMEEDTLLTIAAPGVLANDTDPDSDPLTAVLVTDVLNGTLTLNADGSFTYTPGADFFGTDTFTYKANDGIRDSNSVTVTITVTDVSDIHKVYLPLIWK